MADSGYRLRYVKSGTVNAETVVYTSAGDVGSNYMTVVCPNGTLGYVKVGTIGDAVQSDIRVVKGTTAVSILKNNYVMFPVTDIVTTNTLVGDVSNGLVYGLSVVSDSDLVICGSYTSFNGTSYISKWNGSAWSALGTAPNTMVSDVLRFGSYTWAVGSFTNIGGVSATYQARYNGTNWQAIGNCNGSNTKLVTDGTNIYSGVGANTVNGITITSRVAKYNGSTWSDLKACIYGTYAALTMSYYNGKIFIAGDTSQIADISAPDTSGYITTDGSSVVTFPAISGKTPSSPNHRRRAIVYNPWRSTYWVGGDDGLFEYDGSNWYEIGPFSPVGSGWACIRDMYLDINSSSIFVVGGFTTIGGTTFNGIARWKNESGGKFIRYTNSGATTIGASSGGIVQKVGVGSSGSLWIVAYGGTSFTGTTHSTNGIIKTTTW
jgi:hypothetical protein